MKMGEELRAGLRALADRLTSGYNVTVEAKRAEVFCAAIPALLADLEEAEARARHETDCVEACKAELAATRKQLAEAQADITAMNKSFADLAAVPDHEKFSRSDLRMYCLGSIRNVHNTSALQSAIAEAVEPWWEALADMCEEFRGHDLPYGSVAYRNANSLLNGHTGAKEKSNDN